MSSIFSVFLQVTPVEAPTDPPPETTLHWIPLSDLSDPNLLWSHVRVDVASRLTPKHSWIKILVRILVGSMQFSAIVLDGRVEPREKTTFANGPLPSKDSLKLWGLTLGMTLDLLSCMRAPLPTGEEGPGSPTDYAFTLNASEMHTAIDTALAPSMTYVIVFLSFRMLYLNRQIQFSLSTIFIPGCQLLDMVCIMI
jgi:hypothetical protein